MAPFDTLTALCLPSVDSQSDPLGLPTQQKTGRTSADFAVPAGKSSVTGTFLQSFAPPTAGAETRPLNGIWLVAEHATLHLQTDDTEWHTVLTPGQDSDIQAIDETVPWTGVEVELKHFANAVLLAQTGSEDTQPNLGDVRKGLWDCAFIEACLTSQGKEVILDDLVL